MSNSTLLFSLLPIFLVLLLLLLFRQLSKHGKVPTRKLPPGPTKLPIIGNLHQLGTLPHLSLHDLSNKHGPLMFLQLGSIPTLVISSADALGEVFPSHDIAFSGRPALYATSKIFYGPRDIAFSPYGEYWRQARKLAIIELLSVKRVQSFQAVREEEVCQLISSIRSISQSSAPINLSEMLLSLANDVTSRVVFGRKAGRDFNGILAETQNLLGGFCVSDFFPWLEWVHGLTGLRARLEKNFKVLDRFYDQMIEEHISSSSWPDSEHQDLVHVLLGLHKDPIHGKTFSSMNDVKGMLTDMFIAGTDTSSATIVWTVAELIRNPRVMNKLQEELRNVVGNKTKIDEGDLQKLNYLKLVVKESLRLHPAAPLLVLRETTKMCKLQDYDIPVKTRVIINAKDISQDPKRWTNPKEFWPERFLVNNIDFKGHDLAYVPFGVGRRICPGMNFAMVIIELALANLLYCFNWKLPLGMEVKDLDFDEAIGITMHKKSPLYLLVKP